MDDQNENSDNPLLNRQKYLLKLYITGSTPRSISAVNHITEICKNNLDDYELQIIDVYENPNIAKEEQIIAIPTLIRVLLCKNNLDDYELQIIDVYENPNIAKEEQIIAIPTLIKVLPPPERRIIGDMANTEKVLTGLDHRRN